MNEEKPIGIETNKLIEGMPYETYASRPGVRASHLKEMDRSMAHYKLSLERPQKETDALRFGKIFHAAILEPDLFRERCVVEPIFEGLTKDGRMSTQSGQARDMKKAWYAQLRPDQMVIDVTEREQITGMLNALTAHPIVSLHLQKSLKEVCLWWDEKDVLCKARYDFVTESGIPFDIKTTTDASPKAFEREIFSDNWKYYLQAAHYSAGAKITKLLRGDVFVFIGIEKDAPHGICIKTLNHYGLQPGENIRDRVLPIYKQCKLSDKWPCYDVLATEAMPPKWLFPEEPGV